MSNDFYLRCTCCHQSFESWNFTHNLTSMAEAAGIYQALWHPNTDYTDRWENGWIEYRTAAELLPVLQAGYDRMILEPEHYKSFEPKNGWGTYDGFLDVLAKIISACKEYPNARPYASI